ncbi:hypothetical protein HDU81_000304 [Chytriomyces hyalinus]|nr:hypothetical protein HDU81_000304 [Chytriomyces hyalinus]
MYISSIYQGLYTRSNDSKFDAHYEPTQDEIIEYAKFIGMDVTRDQHLFWIARESLKAPLPKEWKPCKSANGDIYFFNFTTGESSWEHPCDDHYRQLYFRERKKYSNGVGGSGGSLSELSKPIKRASAVHERQPNEEGGKWSTMGAVGTLATGAAVAGAGYMAYQEWQKRNNKLQNAETEAEYVAQMQSIQQSGEASKENAPKSGWGQMSTVQKLATGAAVAGAGYMAYNEWRKYHNKQLNAESEAEHAEYVQAVQAKESNTGYHMSTMQKLAAGAAVAGAGYMAYNEWRKRNNKPEGAESEAEHAAYLQATQAPQPPQAPQIPPEQPEGTWGKMSNMQKLAAGAAVAGAGYMAYNEWQKYNEKQKNQLQQQNGTEVPIAVAPPPPLPPPTDGKENTGGWNQMSHLQKFATEAGVVGAGYMAYQGWQKLHNKPNTPQSEAEYVSTLQSTNPAKSRSQPSLDDRCNTLKSELDQAWSKIEQSERDAFETRVENLKHEYDSKLESEKESLETEVHKQLQTLEEDCIEQLKDIKTRHESRMKKLKSENSKAEDQLRDDHATKMETRRNEQKGPELELERKCNERLKEKERELEEKFARQSELLQHQSELRLEAMKRQFAEHEDKEREEMRKKEERIAEANSLALKRFEDAKLSEFIADKTEIANKYRHKLQSQEEEESQEFEARIKEIRRKNDSEATSLRRRYKNSQYASMDSSFDNLSQSERRSHEQEKENIRRKYESKLNEFKTQERKKFESLRAEVEASYEVKTREVKEAARRHAVEEQELLEKLLKIQSEDARKREEMDRSRLKLESEMRLEKMRLELETETRKAEYNIQNTNTAALDAFRAKTSKEVIDRKERMIEENESTIAGLKDELKKKLEKFKANLEENIKRSEMKMTKELEEDISRRREKAEADMQQLSKLEMVVEASKANLLDEKRRLDLEMHTLEETSDYISSSPATNTALEAKIDLLVEELKSSSNSKLHHDFEMESLHKQSFLNQLKTAYLEANYDKLAQAARTFSEQTDPVTVPHSSVLGSHVDRHDHSNLPLRLNVEEIDFELSNMLGRARRRKEASNYEAHANISKINARKKNAVDLSGLVRTPKTTKMLTAESRSWEEGHKRTDLKLAERRAWLASLKAKRL